MVYILLGSAVLLLGIAQLVFAQRIHAYFEDRNEGRSRWHENPRGWSVSLVRQLGVAAIVAALILISFGTAQISG